jgi:hypothetical protein
MTERENPAGAFAAALRVDETIPGRVRCVMKAAPSLPKRFQISHFMQVLQVFNMVSDK